MPELLHASIQPWGDLRGAEELVRFAFEGGDCEGVFDTLVRALPLAPSDLNPETFASQLHLDELIESCLHVQIGEEKFPTDAMLLRRVLESPPADSSHRDARQTVLRELWGNPKQRADLEQLFLAVRRLRGALEMSSASEPNLVRRKIVVLSELRRCIELLADGFEHASSNLRHLHHMGKALREGPDFARLSELVDAEGQLATVDLRLRLGLDGTIRALALVAISE